MEIVRTLGTAGNISVFGFTAIMGFISFPFEGLDFCFRGNAERCIEKQTPFLASPPRFVACAVKGAFFGVHWSGAKALDRGSGRGSAVFPQEGREEQEDVSN